MPDRLPYETFAHIIRLSNLRPPVFPDSMEDMILPPITASHVCRSWRKALQSDTSMWTCIRIPQMSHEQIQEMLSRSGRSSLNVFIDAMDRPLDMNAYLPDTVSSVFQEMYRFRRLQIYLNPTDCETKLGLTLQVQSYLRNPAPRLRELCLSVFGGEMFVEAMDVLKTLFSLNAPNLKHVYKRVSFNVEELLSTPLFQNLSALHLILPPHVHFNSDTLLDVLELSPCLQLFAIQPARSAPVEFPASSDRRVSLPRLCKLMLWQGSGVDTANLVLKHLIFPPNIYYFITCFDYQSRKSDPGLLSQFLALRRQTGLKLIFQEKEGGEEGLIGISPNMAQFLDFAAYLSYDATSESMKHLPTFLQQSFKLSDITHLSVDHGVIPLDSVMLGKLFFSLVHLEFLYVECWDGSIDVTSFLMVLTLTSDRIASKTRKAPEQEADQSMETSSANASRDEVFKEDAPQADNTGTITSTIPCPSLRELTINLHHNRFKPDSARFIADVFVTLRQMHGYPIETIRFTSTQRSDPPCLEP